jgi:hypothetical protein
LALGFSQAWREVEVFLPELVELREKEWQHDINFACGVLPWYGSL